ncbi:MAG: twin-arginine translocase TatA/TatE family subunit [Chloroflexi bacterium]|nr:MAG: twin-arginine translocase TatA/TatE family subunit [Chloroflexota bacterium]
MRCVSDVAVVLIVVLIIVLIIRGPKTLPELGRIFGRGVREARAEAEKLRSEDDTPKDDSAAT